MPQPSTNLVTAISRDAYRIVFFGMPDAGKSALLGALAQAAETGQSLGGKLIDKDNGLSELRRSLENDRSGEARDAVVPFPIALQPLSSNGGPGAAAAEAVLFDCDGRVANELLTHNDALTGDLSKHALAREVLAADVLVLVIDASADLLNLKESFVQFAGFLHELEQSRGQRAEVGGLPVFLVLTKCDLLAKANDSAAAWLERVEERKEQVRQDFEDFLAESAEREHAPFGQVNLNIWATATKYPVLADAPPRPKEPYGVAELFRQWLDSARGFRERRQMAGQRLGWILGMLGLLVAFMAILAAFFLALQRETELSQFEKSLRSYRPSGTDIAPERLRQPIGKTVKDLQAFRDNPLFAKMPADVQLQLTDQLREAEAYERLSKEFDAAVKKEHLPQAPRFAHNDAQLNAFREVLKQHPLPKEYQAAWEYSDLARRQRQWRDEIEVMESEVKNAMKTFAELYQLDAKLKDRGKYTGAQLDQFLLELKLLDKAMPYRKDNHAFVRNSLVTYSNVAQFNTVAVEMARYDKIREQHKLHAEK